jgi:hypothetical protein
MARPSRSTALETGALPDARTIEHFAISSDIVRASKGQRLDASYFNPAVAHALETLRRSGLVLRPLGDITERVFIPPRFKRIYVDADHGIPFLQGSHVVHFQPADIKYLSRTAHKALDRWIIRAGWVLVTCSGTVGRVTIALPDWDGWAASQHILRIIPNENECPSGYLYSFLASPLGQVQLTAQIYGAVVDELTEQQAKSVLVPLPRTERQRRALEEIDKHARDAVIERSKAVRLATAAVTGLNKLVGV